MNPEVSNQLFSILSVAGPALIAFLVGHYHLAIKNPLTPVTPVVPVVPPVVPVAPVAPVAPVVPVAPIDPNNLPIGQGGLLQQLGKFASILPHIDPNAPIAPVGQGGILQLTTLLLQGILASPATPTQKATAISQVVNATEALNAAVAPVVAPVVPAVTK